MKKQKLLLKIINNPRHVSFAELTLLMETYGFRLVRTKGSHHIYSHPNIPELINLQNVQGRAKPYQIRQFLKLVERYNLTFGDEK